MGRREEDRYTKPRRLVETGGMWAGRYSGFLAARCFGPSAAQSQAVHAHLN